MLYRLKQEYFPKHQRQVSCFHFLNQQFVFRATNFPLDNRLILSTPRWYSCVIYVKINPIRPTVNYLRNSFSDVIFGAPTTFFFCFGFFGSRSALKTNSWGISFLWLDINRCAKKSYYKFLFLAFCEENVQLLWEISRWLLSMNHFWLFIHIFASRCCFVNEFLLGSCTFYKPILFQQYPVKCWFPIKKSKTQFCLLNDFRYQPRVGTSRKQSAVFMNFVKTIPIDSFAITFHEKHSPSLNASH